MSEVHQNNCALSHQGSLRIGDWLWRPVYAKLWWSAVPVYWGGMAASGHVQPLGAFYNSAAAGFLTIFFFPPLVAFILWFGFFREWLAAQPYVDSDAASPDQMFLGADSYGPSGMPCEFDPLDPRSGALWVGNTLNPLNAAYINRASKRMSFHPLARYQGRSRSHH
ncbi:hypothetical protein U5A82_03885 [Sphingobium sp. CR2-8]|uniref:hypothetical protein n=1 Tax=Sphingobium sp. CR2-8 TaxID=1306534 RepID=UPI002DB8C4B1|nr:hypothetical protein [Sphingobium sp. CR2-8]MEC3909640.1 hypothetical protein [Sphingobium sp. CR2-8]